MSNALEILSMDLASVDVSRPVAVAGPALMRIDEMKIEPVKDDPNTQMLVIVLSNAYDLKDRKGEVLAPGRLKLTENLLLGEKGKWTKESTLAGLKRIKLSVGEKDGAFGDPASYLGKIASVRLSIEVDKDGRYEDKNRVNFVEKK